MSIAANDRLHEGSGAGFLIFAARRRAAGFKCFFCAPAHHDEKKNTCIETFFLRRRSLRDALAAAARASLHTPLYMRPPRRRASARAAGVIARS